MALLPLLFSLERASGTWFCQAEFQDFHLHVQIRFAAINANSRKSILGANNHARRQARSLKRCQSPAARSLGERAVLSSQQVKHRFENSSGDGQRFVGDRETVFASGTWIDVANFHSRLYGKAVMQEPAQDTGKAGPHRSLINLADNVAGLNHIPDISFGTQNSRAGSP